jgi:pimeloyl-ACP methyl ester carboxylesterase
MKKLVEWIVALGIALLAMGYVLTGAAKAQEAAGDWHGVLATPQGELRLGVTIKPRAGGGLEGSIESPDQGPGAMPIDDVKVEAGALSFRIGRISASYSGRWDPAAKAWVGQFTQGVAIPLTLSPGKPAPLPVIAGLDGDWEGALTTQAGARLRLVLHVRTTPAAGTVASVDSPDQMAYGVPVRLAPAGQSVTVSQGPGLGFHATLAADGQSMSGPWTGPQNSAPVTLQRRTSVAAAPKRPQTPKPPFPYRAEEVSVPSAPGVTLAGTLTLPQGRGPFPAVVMITGSGAQDRDETILGHKPFAVIADRLTRNGIAVLRVDDRGFAKSTGVFATATDDDFAVDTAAQVAFLRKRGDIDPAKIGLIGHSEGGLVAPKVAAKDPKLAFIVLMAGPGVPLSEVLRAQRAALAPAMGASPDTIRRSQALMDHVDAAMRGSKDDTDAEARALKVIKAEAGDLAPSPATQAMMAKQLSNGWMRTLIDYDPRPTLTQVRCPILALNGSKDGQVPPDQNLPAIRAATKANRDVTIVELANLNHLFQTAKTGAVGEYADIEETVAPVALDTMTAWIRNHVMS